MLRRCCRSPPTNRGPNRKQRRCWQSLCRSGRPRVPLVPARGPVPRGPPPVVPCGPPWSPAVPGGPSDPLSSTLGVWTGVPIACEGGARRHCPVASR
eukprot:6514637-Prymnesium_polylepis.1